MTDAVHVGATPAESDLLRAAIGPNNTTFYERFLAERSDGTGSPVSWNWPAFFVTAYWLLYRKVWGVALLYILVLPLLLAFAMAASNAAWGEEVGGVVYIGSFAVIGFILMPMFANALYAKKVHDLVARAQTLHGDRDAQIAWLARHGGTSWVWIILLIIPLLGGILAAVSLPAYQDYIENANAAKVQSHYYEAVRFVHNELRRAKAAVDMGVLDTPTLELDWDSEHWVAELNATGVTSPSGGAAYANNAVDSEGVVGIRAVGSVTESTYAVTVTRPRYGLLADEPVKQITVQWPNE